MATSDLLGTLEARQILKIGAGDTSNDDLLAQYVTGVSAKLAECVGTIVYGTVTAELQDGGDYHVYLDHGPVASVIQVVEYDGTNAATLTAETNSSKPTTGYWVNRDNGKIVRRDGNADRVFPNGRDNVLVTYVAGRCATTATVPERFKVAAGIMLKNAWRTVERGAGQVGEYDVPQSSFPTFAVPKAVKELLSDEWRTGSGIGD